MNLQDFDAKKIQKSDLHFELVDQWIYSRLHQTIRDVNSKLETYTLDEAAKLVYEFIKGDFCDRYVEMAKVRLYSNDDLQSKQTAQWVLRDVLENALKLLHPFMPFITEELRQQIRVEGETIMLADFPKSDAGLVSLEIEGALAYIQEVITALRNIRAEAAIAPSKEVIAMIKTDDAQELEYLQSNKAFLMKLAKLSSLEFGEELQKPELSGFRVVGKSEIIVPLRDFLDIEAESKKIMDQIAKLEQGLFTTQSKLSNESFVARAPAEVIEREKANLADYKQKIEKLRENLALFSKT